MLVKRKLLKRTPGWGLLAFCFLLFLGGCSTASYRAAADRESYGIIAEKTPAVPGMPLGFTIEQEEAWDPLEGLAVNAGGDGGLGLPGEGEKGYGVIRLEDALRIAVRRNRTYQNTKESLYIAALGLSLERDRYRPVFGGGGGAEYRRTTSDRLKETEFSRTMGSVASVFDTVETITGQPADLLEQYAAIVEAAGAAAGLDESKTEIMNERSVTGESSFDVGVLLKGGGALALGLSSDFLRYLTGDSRTATSSSLVGSFTQPLLKGAGKAAKERLAQAEREVLYAIRDFSRYRKEFTVSICSAYYQVLRNRDRVRNTYLGMTGFQRNVERERAFAREGRRTQAELGRIEQAQLNNENSWTSALQDYKESLDAFKIQLGLSTDARVILDEGELGILREAGLQHPKITAEDAIEVGLAARLDLQNEKDSVEDAWRKVAVAENAFMPDLDLIVEGRVTSTGQDAFTDLDWRRARWNAGFAVDFPLERTAERNAYRRALITHERAVRAYTLAEDTIKLEVRAGWRDLEEARRNYEVAVQSVALNERRVEEQDLLAELGRATAQNQVDAQNDLITARNDLTSALVRHTVARLAFWRDMGILYIKEDGQWEEIRDE